jgi:carboxypeptidase C (cathepsin A)
VGYSIGQAPANNDQVTQIFYSWLKEFYKAFPLLRAKNLYLTGESWGISISILLMIAGVYLPYFGNIIQQNQGNYWVNLKGIGIGNPTLGSGFSDQMMGTVPAVVHRYLAI